MKRIPWKPAKNETLFFRLSDLNADFGFTAADRAENVRRFADVAAHLARSGPIPTERFDVEAGFRQIEHLLDTAGLLCTDEPPAGGDFVF